MLLSIEIDMSNRFNNLEDVLTWFEDRKNSLNVKTEEIGLKDVGSGWDISKDTGNLEHNTKGYFKVIGVRTETDIRESGKGWNQPMIDQGTNSSIVGLIKKDDLYLVEAKFEPGNYGKLLFSPTLQVTYDNLNKLHDGRKPLFSEYFDGKGNIKFNHWYPEDGGRFYKKRTKHVLVEVNEIESIPDSFVWLTIGQIKELLKRDNLVSSHLRSIVATIFAYGE